MRITWLCCLTSVVLKLIVSVFITLQSDCREELTTLRYLLVWKALLQINYYSHAHIRGQHKDKLLEILCPCRNPVFYSPGCL